MHVGTEKAGQIPINLLWPHWSYINSTLALTDAEKGVMTNNNPPMQGQSDWLVNVQMGYDNINTGTQGTLVSTLPVNVFMKPAATAMKMFMRTVVAA